MAQVATTSMVEMTILWASNLPVNPVLFRLLRIGKLARAIRMVTMTNILPLSDSTKSSKCRSWDTQELRKRSSVHDHSLPIVREKEEYTRWA